MTNAPMDSFHELLEDYALGLLDDSERAAFDARLKVDPELQRELSATVETLTALALSTPVSPSVDLKDRVMARVTTGASRADAAVIPMRPRVRRSRAPLWLGAALAASLAIIAKLAMDLRDARHDEGTATAAAQTAGRTVAARDSLLAQLTDPGVELVTMAATGASKPAVKGYINRTRRTMVVSASSLETPPSGQAYQLWFIVGGKAIPSVTFRPDSTGHALVRDVPLPDGAVDATAITREPEGGSAAPTTPVIFLGKPATE